MSTSPTRRLAPPSRFPPNKPRVDLKAGDIDVPALVASLRAANDVAHLVDSIKAVEEVGAESSFHL